MVGTCERMCKKLDCSHLMGFVGQGKDPLKRKKEIFKLDNSLFIVISHANVTLSLDFQK
jgi:hypothetical protein